MMYKLLIASPQKWLKDLSLLTEREVVRVWERIEKLKQIPWPEDVQVKKLKHYDIADFRLRMGDYRILFNVDKENKTVLLLRILHRSKLY